MYTGLSSPLTISSPDNVTGSDADYSVTKYQYDRFNRIIQLTDPLNQNESYTYDLNGNLTGKTDRNGNAHTFVYDGLGRLLSKAVVTPDGTGDETYSYTYTLTGNRLTAAGGGITTTCQYDALGRLIKETETGGIEKTYTYDTANNRKSFILKQDGVTKTNTAYDYDTMNRLRKVYEGGVQTAAYTYDANGNRLTLTYNTSGNSTNYTYNLANKLVSLTNKKGTTTLSGYAYTYYLDGNQATKTDHTNKVTTYVYDDLGRLESESPQGEAAISYTYDDYNNREAMTLGGAITSYVYDKNNRLRTEAKTVSGTEEITRYYYDNNGNQTCKTIETLEPAQAGSTESYNAYVLEGSLEQDVTFNEYDGFNQLKKVITGGVIAEYQYNADGLRTAKKINGAETQYIWDGQNIAAELTGTNMTAKYERGINLICSDMSGTVKYYLFNGHGDVVQLTDSSGNVIKTYDYDAFGNEKNPDTSDSNPFRYSGEYFDRETGTYYLRARYYNPATSRMLSEDTNHGDIRDPLSLNLYTYCYNNPILFIDPTGHDFTFVIDKLIYSPTGQEVLRQMELWGFKVWDYFLQSGGVQFVDLLGLYGDAASCWVDNTAWPWMKQAGIDFVNANNNMKDAQVKATNWIKEKIGGSSGSPDPNKFDKIKDLLKAGDKTQDGWTLTKHAAENANKRGFSLSDIDGVIKNYSHKFYTYGEEIYARKVYNYYELVIKVRNGTDVITTIGGKTHSLKTISDIEQFFRNAGTTITTIPLD